MFLNAAFQEDMSNMRPDIGFSFTRTTANVNILNQCLAIFGMHQKRPGISVSAKCLWGCIGAGDMSYKSLSNIGLLSCSGQLLHSTAGSGTNNININPWCWTVPDKSWENIAHIGRTSYIAVKRGSLPIFDQAMLSRANQIAAHIIVIACK